MRLRTGNRIELLEGGGQYFPALEREIDASRREIFLEVYIFEFDVTGEKIARALIRAAARGVRVHLLVDGFGTREIPETWRRQMREAGVQMLVFRPEISWFPLRRTRLRRLHRKLAVIDGRVGFCGGINILDDVDSPDFVAPRFDYAVRVEGPLLADMHLAVRYTWRHTTWAQLRRRWLPLLVPMTRRRVAGSQNAAFLVRDNFRHRRDIEQAYLASIESARTEIVIANAYFLPGAGFRAALCAACRRGVRVVLLLQGRVEYFLVHYATRALYEELIGAGVEIFEYHRGFLHAKVAVMDGQWSTVGSSNIDPVSLLLAREANVLVEDETFATELRASLFEAIRTGAESVTRERWIRMGRLHRLIASMAYAVVRLLAGISSYGRASDFQ
ncbi:MAG: cardiolipin synthase ClsB [Burkholderiales bacterium]